MALVVLPYSFTPNTLIDATQVDANFAALAAYLNTPTRSFNPNGYVTLPGGLILQWGVANGPAPGPTLVNFPLAFPNNVWSLAFAPNAGTGSFQVTAQYGGLTLTGFELYILATGGSGSRNIAWIAVGN